MSVTFQDIQNSVEIRTYITQADASLIALGFTEHSFAHVGRCADVAARILNELGYPAREVELARIAALGLKGIKLHPAYQATRFDDIRYLRILDRAGELGLVVLTHAGIDIGIPAPTYCDPEMVLRALEQVGPVTLILAHMGGWRQWDQVEALLPQSSVLLDTAFSYGDLTPLEGHPFSEDQLHMMEQEQFVRFVRKFGAQRLLFGTDSPWGDQSADVASIRALPLSSEERDAILGGNAQRLLGL